MLRAIAPQSRVTLLLALVPFLPGCSGRVSAPVSGKVTLNGIPQEGIFIYFKADLPQDHDPLKGLSTSYARTDKEGKFTMKFMDVDKDRAGALVTTHTVTADDERTFASSMEPDGKGGRRPIQSRVPRNWQSRFVVPAEGTDQADFELGTPNAGPKSAP